MIINVECHESASDCASKIEILELIKARLCSGADISMVDEVLRAHIAAHKAWQDAEYERIANDPKVKAFKENIARQPVIYMRRPIPMFDGS